MNKKTAKKRMMFIQKEDYNFLTYNLLLLLYILDCTKEEKQFKDFRKIAYLVDFISSGSESSNFTHSELTNIYSRSQLKKKLISHLLIVLKNRDYLGVSLNGTHKTFDIWLKQENIPKDFFDNELFTKEVQNINALKRMVSSIRTTTVKTMVESLFKSKGVLTWEI